MIVKKIRHLLRRHPFLYEARMALITEIGGLDLGAPPPGEVPPGEVPAVLRERVARLDLAGLDGFEAARRIAYNLSHGHERGPGLGYDSVRAFRLVTTTRAGVCSDYSQLFLALAVAAGLPCREWGFTNDRVGHTCNEVYSVAHRKWIFLDAFRSLWMTLHDSMEPLSAVELVDLAAADRFGDIELHVIDADAASDAVRAEYTERYFRPGFVFFCLSRNDVFRQDRFLRWVGPLPPPLVHGAMLLAGVYQRFHVYEPPASSGQAAAKLERLRRRTARSVLLLALGAAVLGAAVFLGARALVG